MELWRESEHEPPAGDAWDLARAEAAIREIVADAEAAIDEDHWHLHELDREDREDPDVVYTGLYLGAAGMAWALHALGTACDTRSIVAAALSRYRRDGEPSSTRHDPSLLLGETGILLAAESVGADVADRERLRELVVANRAHPTWELLWGSPGTILAADAVGLDAEARDSALALWQARDAESGLWTQHLYGQVERLLGVGHGFAGNVHALRGHIEDAELRALVASVLETHAVRAPGLANWLPVTDPVRGQDAIRVQWCHGAAGIVATIGDLMPPELAAAGAELTWAAGPLRKGPGLCHGTAGNGYALLRLFALTGEERWLERARRFAMHAIAQVGAHRERYGRGRHSLWTGDIGVALYVKSCLDGDPAFPTLQRF